MAADRWVLVAFLLVSALKGGVSLLPTFLAFLTAIQMNEPERDSFFSASLQQVCACLCLCVCVCDSSASVRADRGHSSTSLHFFPLSLRAAVLLKQIGASRLCHRTTQHPSHGVSGREVKANKTDKEGIRARKHLQNQG